MKVGLKGGHDECIGQPVAKWVLVVYAFDAMIVGTLDFVDFGNESGGVPGVRLSGNSVYNTNAPRAHIPISIVPDYCKSSIRLQDSGKLRHRSFEIQTPMERLQDQFA